MEVTEKGKFFKWSTEDITMITEIILSLKSDQEDRCVSHEEEIAWLEALKRL